MRFDFLVQESEEEIGKVRYVVILIGMAQGWIKRDKFNNQID
jgi:hypothetical protein